jgi:hypothetical protein
VLDLLFHLPDRIAARVRVQDPAQAPPTPMPCFRSPPMATAWPSPA